MTPLAEARCLRIKPYLVRACLAECIGTAILVILGDGVLAQVILEGPEHGSFINVSLGWGFAVMMGVFYASRMGRGLINPAISLAFWVVGRLPSLLELVLITLSQLVGAFLGALTVFVVYLPVIKKYADRNDGGAFNATTTGGVFCTWPNTPVGFAFMDQILGTALLASGALTIVDENNMQVPAWAHPLYLGLLVTAIVGSFGYNAGAALNPARDLGPRIFIAMAGWGGEAFSAHNYYFWVPIVGPYVGAVLGAVLYELTLGAQITPLPLEETKSNSQMGAEDGTIPLVQAKSKNSAEVE